MTPWLGGDVSRGEGPAVARLDIRGCTSANLCEVLIVIEALSSQVTSDSAVKNLGTSLTFPGSVKNNVHSGDIMLLLLLLAHDKQMAKSEFQYIHPEKRENNSVCISCS